MTPSVVVRGNRPGRRLVPLGLAALALGAAAIVVIGLKFGQWPGGIDRPDSPLPGGVLIAIPVTAMGIFWLATVGSMIGRSGTLRVAPDRELSLSWQRGPIRVDGEITFARWLEIAPVHTDKGVVAFLPHGGRVLRIAGQDHDGSGYRLDQPATSKFDVRLPRDDFESLLEAIGVGPDASEGKSPVVQLTPYSQTRMMAPWLIVIVVVGAIGITMGTTGLGERIQASPLGTAILFTVIIAIIAAGLLWTFIPAWRPPRRVLTLELGPDELVLGGHTRVPWHSVTATPRTKITRSRYGSSTMAVLELDIPGHKRIRVGCVTREVPWLARRTYRPVRYLVGEPHWHNLIEALEIHDRLPSADLSRPAPA